MGLETLVSELPYTVQYRTLRDSTLEVSATAYLLDFSRSRGLSLQYGLNYYDFSDLACLV